MFRFNGEFRSSLTVSVKAKKVKRKRRSMCILAQFERPGNTDRSVGLRASDG